MMNVKVKYLILVACLVFAFSQAFAQAPGTILYQGKLTDDTGSPITTTTSVTFAIYAAASGGSALYSLTTDIDPDNNGIFTVELGPFGALVFNGSARYLGIKVGADAEMTPRQLITSTPYSIKSNGPGIVHSFDYGGSALSSSNISTDTLTIAAPGPGYIVVQVTGWFSADHPGDGVERHIRACVHTSPNTNNFNNFTYLTQEFNVATSVNIPFSISGVYNVASAGNYTYYLNADCDALYTNAYMYRTHFIATYYPTSYGTVDKSALETVGSPIDSRSGVAE